MELELEKIKIERARLGQMKSSLHSESPFNTQKDNSYQSDRSGNYEQSDRSGNYEQSDRSGNYGQSDRSGNYDQFDRSGNTSDNNDRYQYGAQAESYGMQDGFQNGGRQANMSADR